MKERFWEREGIYGGISWTLQDIQQIWYPAHGIHRKKGVVLAAYTFDPDAGEKFARLTPADRIKLAIEQGSKIHPDYGKYVETGVTDRLAPDESHAGLRGAVGRTRCTSNGSRGCRRPRAITT